MSQKVTKPAEQQVWRPFVHWRGSASPESRQDRDWLNAR